MENLVVDSSVVIKWFVVEPHSTEARRLLNDYQDGNLSLLAPDLLAAEIGNIVWKKQRFQGLSAADGQLIVRGSWSGCSALRC
jgi:predicted nucleic acid-binding protein